MFALKRRIEKEPVSFNRPAERAAEWRAAKPGSRLHAGEASATRRAPSTLKEEDSAAGTVVPPRSCPHLTGAASRPAAFGRAATVRHLKLTDDLPRERNPRCSARLVRI